MAAKFSYPHGPGYDAAKGNLVYRSIYRGQEIGKLVWLQPEPGGKWRAYPVIDPEGKVVGGSWTRDEGSELLLKRPSYGMPTVEELRVLGIVN